MSAVVIYVGRTSITKFPFSRTVSRARRTSGLLNEVADLESGLSKTIALKEKMRGEKKKKKKKRQT